MVNMKPYFLIRRRASRFDLLSQEVGGSMNACLRYKKLSAVNRLRSTNTKTKLDLTKLIQDFHKP